MSVWLSVNTLKYKRKRESNTLKLSCFKKNINNNKVAKLHVYNNN